MSNLLDDLFRFPPHPSAGREFVSHILGRLSVPALVVDKRLHVHLANLQGREMYLRLQPGGKAARAGRRLSAFPPHVKDDVKSCLESGRAIVRSGFEIEALHRRPLDLLVCPGRIEDKDLCFMVLLRPALGGASDGESAFDRLLGSFDVAAVFIDSELRVQKFNDPYLVAFARTAEEITGVKVSNLEMGEQAKVLVQDIRQRITSVQQRVVDGRRPSVLVCVGRNMRSATIDEVYVAGRAGFYEEIITLAGGMNAYQGKGELVYPVITGEGLLRLKPEIIIDMVADQSESGLTEAEVLQQWNSLPDLPAVKQGRVFLFTDDFVVVPGPRFIQILEKMAAVIHPEGIES